MPKFSASIPEKKILRAYLDMVNGFCKLTERERDVLVILLHLDLYWDSDRPKNIIDMNSRRYTMQNTFINKNNLSKYISKFKELGIIKEYEHKKWEIDHNFIPSTLLTGEDVKIEIILKLDKNV